MKAALLGLLIARCAGALLVGPTSPAMFFSPATWHVNETLASAVNPGAYLKFRFSGSTSVALAVEEMPCLWGYCGTLAYSVDNEPMRLVVIPGHSNTSGATVDIPLPNVQNKTLNASAPHTLELHLYNSVQFGNRWLDQGVWDPGVSYADQRQAVLVRGILLDDGAVALPPRLRPKRLIAFGDSITEGVLATCTPNSETMDRHGVLHPMGGDMAANAATKTWVQAVASAFAAEYGQVGFGRQGWTVTGNAQVPPFFTPGQAVNSSWDKIFEGKPRSFKGIDYIFVLHGTNDGLTHGTDPAQVAKSAEGWLHAVRAAAGPNTAVFLTVPFGGFGSKNAPVGTLAAAFAAYQEAKKDARTFFLDLGADAAAGLECAAYTPGCVGAYGTTYLGPSEQGCDGIHPRGGTNSTARHGELGAMLAVRAALALAGNADLLDA